MKPETLTVRYASLERLRQAWYRRIAQGKLYVPCPDPLAEGAVVILQITTPDTPAPLELEGAVLSIHNVQSEGQLLRGVELTLHLPSFIRTAVEAYLASDWGRAAPVMGDSSKVEALWTTFGASPERPQAALESGSLTARRHRGAPPTTDAFVTTSTQPPHEPAFDAFPRELTVRVSSPALALTPPLDDSPPPPPPPTTRRPVAPPATESQESAATIPPGAFIFRKH